MASASALPASGILSGGDDALARCELSTCRDEQTSGMSLRQAQSGRTF